MLVSRFKVVQLDKRLKLFFRGSDIDGATPNVGDDLQAGPSEESGAMHMQGQSSVGASTPAVLEVGAGAASSSTTVTPPVSTYSYA